MQLKLAEYNSDGEFERFLEIGKDFVYGGYYILITEKMTPLGVLGFADTCSFNRDEKDPLNRFNGLFDGRTYGNGRFVLTKDGGDDVYVRKVGQSEFKPKLIGNLHQNPELYEKVKNEL